MAVISLLNCLDDETPRQPATPIFHNTGAMKERLALHVAQLLTLTDIDQVLLFYPPDLELGFMSRIAPQVTLCPVQMPLSDKLDSFYRETQRLVSDLGVGQEQHRILYIQVSLANLLNVNPRSLLAPMQYFEDEKLEYLSSEILPKGSCAEGVRLEYTWLNLLHEAWQEALLPDDRLLVTPYIARQDQRLRVARL